MAEKNEAPKAGARRIKGPALGAVLFVGLLGLMLSSPVFPLAPRLLDRVQPGVNVGTFTVSAGIAVLVVAIGLVLKRYAASAPERLQLRALATEAIAYALALLGGLLLMGLFGNDVVAMAFGVALGIGIAFVFMVWGAAAAAVARDVRSFGQVLAVIGCAMACAALLNMAAFELSRPIVAAVVVLTAVASIAAPLAVLADRAVDGCIVLEDKATFAELLDMGLGAGGISNREGDGLQDSQENSSSGAEDPGKDEPASSGADVPRGTVRGALLQLALPVVILLLYAASQMASTSIEGHHALVPFSVLAAPLVALVPLAVKDDSQRIAFALRNVLPFFGIAVLGAAVLAPDSLEASVAALGAQALCYAYGITLLALITYFALARAGSAMPVVGAVAAAALGVVMMLPHLLSFAAAEGALPVFLAVLVASLCLLAATPSISAWSGAFSVAQAASSTGAQAGQSQSNDESAGETLADKVQAACDAVADAYALSPREREILHYLGRGYGPRYLATILPIKENTIRSHVRNIYTKTDVHTQPDLLVLIDSFAE
ncbi:helix-turn-helix transcriptional regulator [Slackia heliotrinireducens]|uniref:helix-turn-helix transcriptional regulator n=1 Tax=Slackia heliotrinireducens TaxID=84110 RepID=UPI003315E3A8